MVQSVVLGSQDKQTMNDVAMETPSDAAVALATKSSDVAGSATPPDIFLTLFYIWFLLLLQATIAGLAGNEAKV